MSETNEITDAVVRSLREKPTLNTPTLIAGGGIVPEGIDQSEIERALDDLVAAGRVKHRATGWKLAPESA
jgi:hypothetical protein